MSRCLCGGQGTTPGVRCCISISGFMWVLGDLIQGLSLLGKYPLSHLSRPHWSVNYCSLLSWALASEELYLCVFWAFERGLRFWFLKNCLIVYKISDLIFSHWGLYCSTVFQQKVFLVGVDSSLLSLMTDMIPLYQRDPFIRAGRGHRPCTIGLYNLMLYKRLLQRMQAIHSFWPIFFFSLGILSP